MVDELPFLVDWVVCEVPIVKVIHTGFFDIISPDSSFHESVGTAVSEVVEIIDEFLSPCKSTRVRFSEVEFCNLGCHHMTHFPPSECGCGKKYKTKKGSSHIN
jgi:hypothetical protein